MRALALALVISGAWFHNGRGASPARGINGPGGGSAAPSADLSNTYSTVFDGDNDCVTIGQPADLEIAPTTDRLSFAAWFRRGVAADYQRHIGGKATMGGGGQVGALLGVSDDEQIYTLVGGGNNTSGGNIVDHGWHLAGVSINAGTARLYLDGVQVGTTFAVGGGWNVTADWLIGATRYDSNADTGYPFLGKIDEMTYWGGNLTTAEHLELYHSGEPMNPVAHSRAAVLLHWYRMGDGDTYPTITDQIGTADGTATNMAGASSIANTDVP